MRLRAVLMGNGSSVQLSSTSTKQVVCHVPTNEPEHTLQNGYIRFGSFSLVGCTAKRGDRGHVHYCGRRRGHVHYHVHGHGKPSIFNILVSLCPCFLGLGW